MGKKKGQMKPTPQQQALFGDLGKMNDEVQAALKLLDSETADALIGEQTDDYRTLIAGCKALCGLAWATFKLHGLRQKQPTLELAAKNLLLHASLVHYAYALGIKRGQDPATGVSGQGEPSG